MATDTRTDKEWYALLDALAWLAMTHPKFRTEIEGFVFEITRGLPCEDPTCAFCVCQTKEEFSQLLMLTDRDQPQRVRNN